MTENRNNPRRLPGRAKAIATIWMMQDKIEALAADLAALEEHLRQDEDR